MQEHWNLDTYAVNAGLRDPPDWFKEVFVRLYDPYGKKTVPRRHQVTGLNWCFTRTRFGLYDEQGTGKTLISQAFAIWNAAVGNKTLILMPPSLLYQYKTSISSTFEGIERFVSIAYLKDRKERPSFRREKLRFWKDYQCPDIVLSSYELFLREFEYLPNFSTIIMDEANVIGNSECSTYEKIETLLGEYGEKLALVMTGTPAFNTLENLYGFIRLTNPEAYVSLKHFRNVHVKYKDIKVRVKASLTGKDTRMVKAIDGYKDVSRIMSNLFKNGRRLCKTDVVELPPKNVIVTKVSLEDEHYERYKKFVEERMLEFSDGTILDGSTSAGLRQSALQAVLRPDILGLTGKSEVVQAIREITVPVVKEGRKVFILAHYRETVKLIMEEFKAFNPVSMFGETSNKAESLRAFLEDKDCGIMVANYKSGGAGLNLQSVCETVICAEPTSVPGQFNQGTDRAHRVGQVNPVNVYILVAVGTVYVKQVKNMVKKQVAIDSVVVSNDLLAELLGDPGRDSEAEQFVIESSEDIDLPEPHP